MSIDKNALLHDLILAALTAASIFIKNPERHAEAAKATEVAKSLLPLLEPVVSETPKATTK